MPTSLGSLLLGSARPDELRAWYRQAFAPDHTGDGPMEIGDFVLVIEGRVDVATTNAEPGRMIHNFHVDDIDGVAAHLDTLGVEWVVEVEQRETAKFATFLDPDGNYLQLIQFDDGHEVG